MTYQQSGIDYEKVSYCTWFRLTQLCLFSCPQHFVLAPWIKY